MTRAFAMLMAVTFGLSVSARAADLRLGLVGTDTSHVIGFATAFNDPS